jgi:hypothetical protein
VNPLDILDTAQSAGRRMPVVLKNSDDQIQVFDQRSTPCPGCGQVTSEGEEITKIYQAWWHAACARGWLETAGTDEAWKAIARQVAARPNRYRAQHIRTVIEQLLRMAGQPS